MAKSQIITGIDIGTSSIKTLIAQRKKGEEFLEILKTVKSYSFGLRKGIVDNPIEVAKNIKNSVILAQKKIEKSVNFTDSVYVNIGGSHIYFTPSRGVISVSRADKKISQEDMERALGAAETVSLLSNYKILDTFPQEFIIDNQGKIKEPVGLTGIRLEVKVFLLCVFSPYLKNLTKSVLETGLQIEDITASPLAAARAVVTPREKELGVALVDIGAATTGLAVFEEGNLIHLAVFPIGSANITNDIAIGLKIKIDTAEKIKRQFGSCLLLKEEKAKAKKIIKIFDNGNSISFSQKFLTGIVEARVCEIFELINKELKKISRQQLLPAGVILTGGGAKLKKIVELSKRELKLPSKIGFPQGIIGIDPDTALSTVAGLVLGGSDLEIEKEKPSPGITSRMKKMLKNFIP